MPRLTRSDTIGNLSEDVPQVLDVPEPDTPISHCDYILGVYLRVWNKLETSLNSLIPTLIGTDKLRGQIIADSMQQAPLRDLLRDIGSHYLDKDQRTELNSILDEVRVFAGVRNRLIHGHWGVHIELDEKTKIPKTVEWRRMYPVSDRETLEMMTNPNHQKSKSLKKRHFFSDKDIDAEASKILPLVKRIKAFRSAMNVEFQPLEAPKPRRKPNSRKQR